MTKRLVILGSLAVLFMAAAGASFAAEDVESRVPELEAFHQVVYPIWHTAYPEKDIAALKSYVPEIQKLAGAIYAATLPGILRDKQARWDAGVAEFKKAVDAYASAAQGSQDQILLDAAEVLHARYEMLVRTIRPLLKEMDEFHKVLYVVYHKSLPEGKYDAVRAVAPELAAKAEAVTKAVLSKRMESKGPAFSKAASDMLAAARSLDEVCRSGKDSAIKDAVETLHARYQSLEKVFD